MRVGTCVAVWIQTDDISAIKAAGTRNEGPEWRSTH